jgi:cysteine desulfurase/selenocysteine lyase
MQFYGVPGTIRASFAFYNTKQEIDEFIKGLERTINMLR